MRRRKTDVGISTIRDGRTRPIDVGVLAGRRNNIIAIRFGMEKLESWPTRWWKIVKI